MNKLKVIRDGRSEIITVRLTPYDLAFLDQIAHDFANMSRSAAMSYALKFYRDFGQKDPHRSGKDAPAPTPRRATPSPISRAMRWEVLERDNFTCQHCGARRFLEVDHIIPRIRGGESSLDNLQTLCKPCNTVKNDRIGQGTA